MARARRSARAVSAGRVVADVRRGVEEGWPDGLTVLVGDDAWHADRAQALLLDALVPADARAFALTAFADEKVEVGTVISAARSVGMFSSRRVVLVRDASLLEGEPAPLEEYAAAPPPGSHLLVRAASIDQRRKLGKALAASGRLLRFERGGEGEARDLQREVRAMAVERGLDLGEEHVGFLLTAADGNLYAVASELDKVRAWSGAEDRDGRPIPVSIDDLRALVASSASMSGWEIADALLARNEAAGVSAARRLVARGEEPLRLLGGLAWRIRAMVQAKALASARVPAGEIGRRLRLGWQADRLIEAVRRYSMEELRAFPYLVAEADRALKSRGLDGGAVIERLVIKLVRGAGVGPVGGGARPR